MTRRDPNGPRSTARGKPGHREPPAPEQPAQRWRPGTVKAEPRARSRATASRWGDQVARPERPSPGVRIPRQPGSPSPPGPSRDSPSQGRRTVSRPEHQLPSLCPDPVGSTRARIAPHRGALTYGCGWLGALLRASPLPAGSAPAAGQGRGAGRLPLGSEVPGRLPPGVAVGRGPRQQERDAGGPEEQSGPHDRRRRVPPARLGSGAARGGGGCRPSPLLLAPRGANQRVPSWHAEPSRGAGDAKRRGRGPPGDAAQCWGVSGTLE